jgi:hypothetical protein
MIITCYDIHAVIPKIWISIIAHPLIYLQVETNCSIWFAMDILNLGIEWNFDWRVALHLKLMLIDPKNEERWKLISTYHVAWKTKIVKSEIGYKSPQGRHDHV